MKAYVITLRGNINSVQSANKCIDSGRKFNLDIQKWNATTPEDNPIEMAKARGIDPDKFREVYSRQENCIAAFMSHYSLWEECAKGDEKFVIFEHDAIMYDAIPPAHFNYVMNLGHPSYGQWKKPQQLGINPLTTKRYFPGAHAYMITPAGGRLLVENAPMYAKPTDVYMNLDTFPWLQEWYPFIAEARDGFTTIQVEAGCQAKHNWKEGYEIIDA